MGGWIWVDHPAPLKKLARRFVPLLDDTENSLKNFINRF